MKNKNDRKSSSPAALPSLRLARETVKQLDVRTGLNVGWTITGSPCHICFMTEEHD